MFALALLIGIYSYIIFILGLIGALNKELIIISSFIFIIFSIYFFYKKREDLPKINLKNKAVRPYFVLLITLALVNLFGALGPEYSFDALWYHLGLPKIFLQEKIIFAITQGNFYYSLMPKLGEMLFTPFVALNLEVFAKLTQWVFGILTSIVIYKISRRYFDEKKSFFAVLIFYGSLVVAWESTVAYVDLIRAFFEIMAVWAFLEWRSSRSRKILIEAGIFLGLAVSTKLFALGSIALFLPLFIIGEKKKIKRLKNYILFSIIALLSASPWFLSSFLGTGNPIFPIFSHSFFNVSYASLFYPFNFIKDLLILFVKADDPISPLYIIFLPFLFFYFKKLSLELKLLSVYFILALIFWYFTPRIGGGRFILPYLTVASIICIGLIEKISMASLRKYSYVLVIIVFASTILYRGIANSRYIPVVFGFESKAEFLTKHLNFNFGDFYDIDGFFKNNIKESDRVLLYGFHNLYYVDFPFVDSSYVKKGDAFNYIAVQNSDLPKRFSSWDLIYSNSTTGVSVFTQGGLMWHY